MRIAFYSYKGGVGRTKIMVGVGALLAMKGFRVRLLDFDLDASSLANIFDVDPEGLGQNELLNILSYSRHLQKTQKAMINVTDFLIDHFKKKPDGRGRLEYLPTVSQPKLSSEIDLNEKEEYVKQVIDLAEKETEGRKVDWLLIDLQPGYSPSANVILSSAMQVSRTVIVSRLDSQNIQGLKRVIPKMLDNRLDPILVANMVPSNHEKSETQIRQLGESCRYPVAIRIDYDADLVFDNDIDWAKKPNSTMRLGLESLIEEIEKIK